MTAQQGLYIESQQYSLLIIELPIKSTVKASGFPQAKVPISLSIPPIQKIIMLAYQAHTKNERDLRFLPPSTSQALRSGHPRQLPMLHLIEIRTD